MAGLGGCSSPPKPPKPTTVEVRLNADADVNPDARGRASPLSVRVYALKTSSLFEAADFFTLFEKDQATLGAELLRREEVLLNPGQGRVLNLTLPDDARVLAFMAAYRDLDRSRWRELSQITANQAQVLQVRCAARQLSVSRAG
ncbi:type VI secretion system lipoprotein TssJ [Diaphorobacter aerolatus]|uniref:Type VI secretion system lipoprotein TssJ n=2 Tax=Diaphorobacter aerolatus TaxID=1288495 RepID=A0A7H0GQ14_9BURK|nr:type VI secretion system lipoprotein TssJ [Diaphorobacter aerolatus]